MFYLILNNKKKRTSGLGRASNSSSLSVASPASWLVFCWAFFWRSSQRFSFSALRLAASCWASTTDVETLVLSMVVFEGPVRSGLWASRGLDRDRDRSSPVQKPQKTGPNRRKPVQCGLLRSFAVFCGLSTGLNRSLPKKEIKNILSR
jgi:hypothetical protein